MTYIVTDITLIDDYSHYDVVINTPITLDMTLADIRANRHIIAADLSSADVSVDDNTLSDYHHTAIKSFTLDNNVTIKL